MPQPISSIPTAGYVIKDGFVKEFGPVVVRTAEQAEQVRAQRRDNPMVQDLIPRRRAREREAELEAERDNWRDLALRRKAVIDSLTQPGSEAR